MDVEPAEKVVDLAYTRGQLLADQVRPKRFANIPQAATECATRAKNQQAAGFEAKSLSHDV